MDQGSVLVVGKVRNLIYRPQPEVDPETVIIKAHISGAYLSNIMLDNRIVK